MPETPRTTIRIPLYIKEAIKKRTNNLSKWVIEAIQDKLKKES